jgi:hypothetical protein
MGNALGEGFRVEFRLGRDGEVDELFFHQPNGTFVARRVVASRDRFSGPLRQSLNCFDWFKPAG